MSATATLPRTGTWVLDPSHSSIEFVAKHLVVSRVRGRFSSFSGTLDLTDPVEESSIDVHIDAASITTNDETRDGHLVSDDFLGVESFPTIRFTAQGAERQGEGKWTVPGELTIRDVTKTVEVEIEYLGLITDPWGNDKAVFAGSAEIDREAFGITWNQALETGGVLVGKHVKIELDVQFAPQD